MSWRTPENLWPLGSAMPPVALLAGGLATRLGAVTAHAPKSMVEVAGEPFVAHQLRRLVEQGVCDVVVCCGHLAGQIADFVGDGARFGCRVRYSVDGAAALGTGGAIVKALPLLGPRFWVMYGDSYLTVDFRAALRAFEASGKAALMTVLHNEGRWDASNVEFDDGCITRYDKHARAGELAYIDYGLSLFRAEAFDGWGVAGAFDLSLAQQDLIARGEMAGFEAVERFYEIGSPAGLCETDAFLRGRLLGVCA